MQRHRYLIALLWLCFSVWLLCPGLAGAIETLDQSQPVSMSPTTVNSDTQLAQIFTPGLYGKLNRVSLYLENWSTNPPTGAFLTVSIQTVIDGLPSGKQIASGTILLSAIPPSGSPGWVDVSIGGESAVMNAGTKYALILQTSPWNAHVTWWFAYTSYAGGEMAFNDGTAWTMYAGDNLTFKTYVIPDTLDQWAHSLGYPSDGSYMAQTFTAGLSGVLDRVRVCLHGISVSYPTTYLNASIQTVNTGGYPSGVKLGEGWIPDYSIPFSNNWISIGISGAVVTAGTQYALVLRSDTSFVWWQSVSAQEYTGGDMMFNYGNGWTLYWGPYGWGPRDAAFETYVSTLAPTTSSPPPPPATITPCSFGICPAVRGRVTPPDSTARVLSNFQFQETLDGTVHGILNFNDSKTGDLVLEGCTTSSAACRLAVTTFACTDQHAITVAGTYTPKGEPARLYLLSLSGVSDGIGTFTLTIGDYTYTVAHKGIVDVTCPLVAGVVQ